MAFEVYYTGEGSNKSGRHSKKRFLEIMESRYGYYAPKRRMTLKDWLMFSGAVLRKEIDKKI